MSLQAREALVKSPLTIFQRDSQRADLLDENATDTDLVALLLGLVEKGHAIEFTAIKSDHHNDSELGRHSHFNGFAADLWPLASPKEGDYLDAGDARFAAFLRDVAASPWTYQVGLAGSADTGSNHAAAGPTCFSDDGGDHVHVGAQG